MRVVCSLLLLSLCIFVVGCVNQYPEGERGPKVVTGNEQVVATSRAVVQIMDALDVDLIGVPKSELEASEAHKSAANIGASMEPDMEIIRSLSPDWVFCPQTLEASLGPRFEAARVDVAFLNLRSVEGMYTSIEQLGPLLARESQAQSLVDDFKAYRLRLQSLQATETPLRVLVLMGLPGSYLVATPQSYVGSLVELAGAENVYADQTAEFINANTEDMLARDPDVILRAAHALPDDVVEMFAKEFRENDIWKHFRAVSTGRVYDLPHDEFGMSATFEYPAALQTLQELLYP
ncbi:MAG: heme ABC transporter substrate-binding protein IsdE [Actinomycetes bacterium]|jgi:iron complex transport system substrate-binding protein|nr:heme ABC transporter substrate-binding protein IsdE [Actinomycetes bacterium]